ncbi:MAG: GNAT family N-acetyltransferase [Nitrospirae bacterium]|nr:GNAT family N-acetyltransferase [Nitrospirota bacterium]MBI5696875.1 GNAT family N-acetyltransferase [Nitrospirota bacterium]
MPGNVQNMVPADRGRVIYDGEYSVCVISGDAPMTEAYALRHRVFCDELGWVGDTGGGLEVDGYDRESVPFGVYGGDGSLVAYMRLIPPGGRFMLDGEFACLVAPRHTVVKGPDSAEVSRLCVSPVARAGLAGRGPGQGCALRLLFKGVYQWCLGRGIRYIYAAAEEGALRLYRLRGLPLRPLGGPVRMPDGALVRAVRLDWREFEEKNRVKDPVLLGWYQSASRSPSSDATAAA